MTDTPRTPAPFDAGAVATEFVAAFKRANDDVQWCPKRLLWWLTREIQDAHDAGAEGMRDRAADRLLDIAETYDGRDQTMLEVAAGNVRSLPLPPEPKPKKGTQRG